MSSHDGNSPRLTDPGTPKFTEQFNASPPYQQFQNFAGENTGAPEYTAELDGRDMQHRLSRKGRPLSPSELVSPFPQAVDNDHDEKEVALPPVEPGPYTVLSEAPPARSRRICGLTTKWFYILLALLILLVLAIALGVGLGVGLTQARKSDGSGASSEPGSVDDQQYLIGGALNPKYFSTIGAFNGSGIALASQSFASSLQAATQGSLVMYFQHWTGQIRWIQLSNTGSWIGGSYSQVVANDAKNSTPISAVSYSLNGTSTWHIFYIDRNNTIKQRSNSASTNVWVDGPINALNLKAFDADEVGLQACWYGNDYGDSEYYHTPLPGSNSSTTSTGDSNENGMHLWYAKDNSTFQQLGWREGDVNWAFQDVWTGKNGHAGVGCYSWAENSSTTYVMFVNQQNTVEFWWKDTNTSMTATPQHPINKWVNSSIAINNVWPSSSLGYTNYFYAQSASDLLFHGYNISWAAENTTITSNMNNNQGFAVGSTPGLPGSHLSVTAIPNVGGGNTILVFYQTLGNDVSEYTRDLVQGQWSGLSIPIPAQ